MLSTAKPGAGKPSGGSQWVPAQRPWPRTQRYKRKNSENHSLMFSTKTSARGNSTSASKQALVTQLDKVECKERQLHGGQMEAKNMHPNEYIYIYIIIILYRPQEDSIQKHMYIRVRVIRAIRHLKCHRQGARHGGLQFANMISLDLSQT